jgi:hypothetical protein
MEHAPTILASPMQQQRSLQREVGNNPVLVPATTKALVGTIACDADDAAQQVLHCTVHCTRTILVLYSYYTRTILILYAPSSRYLLVATL